VSLFYSTPEEDPRIFQGGEGAHTSPTERQSSIWDIYKECYVHIQLFYEKLFFNQMKGVSLAPGSTTINSHIILYSNIENKIQVPT